MRVEDMLVFLLTCQYSSSNGGYATEIGGPHVGVNKQLNSQGFAARAGIPQEHMSCGSSYQQLCS